MFSIKINPPFATRSSLSERLRYQTTLKPNIRWSWSKTMPVRLILSHHLLNDDSVIDALLPINIRECIYESKWFIFRASVFPHTSHWTNVLSGKSALSPPLILPLFYVNSWEISTRYYNWKSSYWGGIIHPPYRKSHDNLRVDSIWKRDRWSISGINQQVII